MGGAGVGVGPGMISPQQAMFMQQQGMGGPRAPFPQQGGLLQGPLAYLEKTTSNIGTLPFIKKEPTKLNWFYLFLSQICLSLLKQTRRMFDCPKLTNI